MRENVMREKVRGRERKRKGRKSGRVTCRGEREKKKGKGWKK